MRHARFYRRAPNKRACLLALKHARARACAHRASAPSQTTVVASAAFPRDRLWLNGVEEDISRSPRVTAVLREMRARAGSRKTTSGGEDVPASVLAGWRVHIVSRNTFPTAAGLASSAAGYACLVHALADALGVSASPAELSVVARQGSGSACRSLFGGFVRWDMGARPDGADSRAVQVADEAHWPELCVLIAVVSDAKKETGSTDGMATSVATSPLLAHRAAAVVPGRLAALEAAYLARDFAAFGELTMRDSNQFHACCLDTFPPVFYMNDTSRRLVGLVHAFNADRGACAAAYTFDAGPNAVIYTTRAAAPDMLAVLLAHFPDPRAAPAAALPRGYAPYAAGGGAYVSCAATAAAAAARVPALAGKLACAPDAAAPGALRYIYVTGVGDGPRTLDPAADSLAGDDHLPRAGENAGADFARAL